MSYFRVELVIMLQLWGLAEHIYELIWGQYIEYENTIIRRTMLRVIKKVL